VPSHRIVIELSASSLTATVCSGHTTTATLRRDLLRGEWPTPWTEALREADLDLSTFVREHNALGWATTIIYHAPGTLVGATSCAASAGRSAALNAARLQLTSIATFPLSTNPHDSLVISRDSAATPTATAPQVHILATADTEQTIAALTLWAESAGLTVESLVPAEVVASVIATQYVSARSQPNQILAAIWLGNAFGVLAVGSSSRLLFVRTISTGLSALVEGLLNPMRLQAPNVQPQTSDAGSITLDRARAQQLLAEFGIPTAQQQFKDLPGLTGAAVLPGLQPPLQRLAVEVKQSLRFGVPEELRSTVRLVLCGPGAEVPGLESMLARLASITAREHNPAMAEPNCSLTSQVLQPQSLLPCLLSSRTADRVVTTQMRRALGIGLGVAAMFLGVTAISAFARLEREQQHLLAVKAQSDGNFAMNTIPQASIEARAAITSLQKRIDATMGHAPAWSALLANIAANVPASVRIQQLSISGNESMEPASASTDPTCTLRGFVDLSKSDDPSQTIKHLAESLSALPIVANVRLGSTQRTTIRRIDAQSFEFTLTLVPIPVSSLSHAPVAIAPEEALP